MRDPSTSLEQEAIGMLGVSLIYAAFYQLQTTESFFDGLAQDVVRGRIEIDFVDFRGPAFAGWDRPAVLAYLVRAGFAEAVFFSSTGASVPPNEVFYKKPVVLAPGRFGHVDLAHAQIHARILSAAIQELRKEPAATTSAPVGAFCLSAAPPSAEASVPEIADLRRR